MVSPPLTTVRIRQHEMGVEAARLLLARMNGQEFAADVLLRPELVQRRSTAAPLPRHTVDA
jgi:LacI family transcriptional regulator